MAATVMVAVTATAASALASALAATAAAASAARYKNKYSCYTTVTSVFVWHCFVISFAVSLGVFVVAVCCLDRL